MSYCVNCGVELDKSEPKCPLCNAPVVNPLEPPCCDGDRAFPARRDVLEHAFDRDLWVQVVSVVLAVPAIICLVANLLESSAVTWSLYVIGGLAAGWTYCVSPFLFRKYFPILWIIACTIATLGYLYLVQFLASGAEALTVSGGWFLPLAMPIVLGVAVLSLTLLILIRRGVLKDLHAAAAVFGALGLLTVLVEGSLDIYLRGEVHLGWSWYSLVSCVAMAAVLVMIEGKLRVKEKLKRKLHI